MRQIVMSGYAIARHYTLKQTGVLSLMVVKKPCLYPKVGSGNVCFFAGKKRADDY